MATQTKKASIGTGRDPYVELMRKFRLRPLRTDEDLDRAIEMIDSLTVRGDLERGEQDYLEILTGIVEKYETAEHPMPPVSDAAMLRHLIEARGVKQSKLAADVKIPNGYEMRPCPKPGISNPTGF